MGEKKLQDVIAAENGWQIATMRDHSDSLDLRYGVYAKNPENVDRWIVFMNGRSEWIEKYNYLPHDLDIPDNCGFLTWDHRGQGKSGGARAFVDAFESYARDANVIISEVVGDKPYVLMAHSMGGLVAVYSTVTSFVKPKALVVSSPLLGLPTNTGIPHALARVVSRSLESARCGQISSGIGSFYDGTFENNILTNNYDLFQRMHDDTEHEIPTATFGWISQVFGATELIFEPERFAKIDIPTLVLGAGADEVVNNDAIQNWVTSASEHTSADILLRFFAEAKHELFSETLEFYKPVVTEVRKWFADFLDN